MNLACGHTVTDRDGTEEPCERPATGWRWYQGFEHEDCLAPACEWHENEGGRRMHAAETEVERLRAELAEIDRRIEGARGIHRRNWQAEADRDRAEAALARVREVLDDMSGEMSAGAYLTLYAELTEETK